MITPFLRRTRRTRQEPYSAPELKTPADFTREDDGSGAADYEDLSYDDALFDREARILIRSEFRAAQPPPDAAYKLVSTIERHKHASPAAYSGYSRSPGTASGLAAFFGRTLRSHSATGLVSTGIALLLMLFASGPSMSRLIDTREAESTPIVHNSVLNEDANSARVIAPGKTPGQSRRPQTTTDRGQVLYDPTYDDPTTWTPSSASETKFSVRDSSVLDGTSRTSDSRRLNTEPQ